MAHKPDATVASVGSRESSASHPTLSSTTKAATHTVTMPAMAHTRCGCGCTIIAWCAGVWEGEGCAYIKKQLPPKDRVNVRLQLCVSACNSDLSMLTWFQQLWGGRIRTRNGTALTRKQMYEWKVEAAKAERFLRDVEPFVYSDKRRETLKKCLSHREQMTRRRSPYATANS